MVLIVSSSFLPFASATFLTPGEGLHSPHLESEPSFLQIKKTQAVLH